MDTDVWTDRVWSSAWRKNYELTCRGAGARRLTTLGLILKCAQKRYVIREVRVSRELQLSELGEGMTFAHLPRSTAAFGCFASALRP
jgi:hypothetical protein